MLPYLRPQKAASVIMASVSPKGDVMPEGEEGEDPGLMAAAEDLIRAVHAKDAKAVAEALRAAVLMAGLAPEEAPNLEGGV
jgi:hypothetical protein